jgi:hypothetical protein
MCGSERRSNRCVCLKRIGAECEALPAPEGLAELLPHLVSKHHKARGRSGPYPKIPAHL